MNLLPPLSRAFAQLGDPEILGVLLRSLLLTALVFLLLGGLVVGGVQWALPRETHWAPHWLLGWGGGLIGVIFAAMVAMLLFVPVVGMIAMLFADRIAAAVERHYYPQLPPARPAALMAQFWDALALGLRILLLQILALALAILLPGPGLLLGWLVSAWGMGRGLFMMVAMRRMPRAAASAAYRARRFSVIGQGGIFVLAGLAPLLNLLAPVLGVAAMVHVLNDPENN